MKNIKEINTSLQKIFTAGANLKLFLGISTAHGDKYVHADLDTEASEEIFTSYTESILQYFENRELAVQALSHIDNRSNVLLQYDLPTKPSAFSTLLDLVNNKKVDFFSFANNDLKDVKTIAIKISSSTDSVLFFKQLYPGRSQVPSATGG